MPASWSDGYATGVAEIDAQHRELLELVSGLLGAMDREPAAVARALDFLGDYVVSHFDAERRLMEAHGYPAAEAHRAAHEGFVRAYGRLRFDYDLDGLTDGMRELIGGWMIDWLKGHIVGEDKELGLWLAARGRAEAALSPGRTWVVPSGAALRVLSVAPGKGLHRAGVEPGDLILALGGKRVTEIGVDQAVATLSAPGAGGLTLTVHPGGDRERIVTRFMPRKTSPGIPTVQ